jgi:hypothetical protein
MTWKQLAAIIALAISVALVVKFLEPQGGW